MVTSIWRNFGEKGDCEMPTRKFNDLTKNWPAERRQRVAKRVQDTLRSMHLEELRKAREMTQTKMAEILGVAQSEISKVEHRADLYISTLAEYVRALGGELEVRAVFPDGDVKITQFELTERVNRK
jgi:DNA-binding XRE family transcriptional regulator